MKFTKLEAIQEMVEIGSHTILLESSEQLVNDICEPFGITRKRLQKLRTGFRIQARP